MRRHPNLLGMGNFTFGSLCSGIGGLDLGLAQAGFRTLWQAEIDKFASSVLEKRFPGVPNHGDVTKLAARADLAPVDVLVGGIPCQPHSTVGRRKGGSDERNLWPHFRDIITLLQPKVVLLENVPGILTSDNGRFLYGVLRDLDFLGYWCEWETISAEALGLPHKRERVFLVATKAHSLVFLRPGCYGKAYSRQLHFSREPTIAATRTKWPKSGRYAEHALYVRDKWPFETSLTLGAGESLWPTPRAGEAKQGPSSFAKHCLRGDIMLSDAVTLEVLYDAGIVPRGELPPPEQSLAAYNEALRPEWVERLMGFPDNYSNLHMPTYFPRGVGPRGWPEHEEVRTTPWDKREPNWAARLRCLGDAVTPPQARWVGNHIRNFLEMT